MTKIRDIKPNEYIKCSDESDVKILYNWFKENGYITEGEVWDSIDCMLGIDIDHNYTYKNYAYSIHKSMTNKSWGAIDFKYIPKSGKLIELKDIIKKEKEYD